MMLKFFLVTAAILGVSQGAITGERYNEAINRLYEPVKPFILGGNIVSDRLYPSLVSLQINKVHYCGGVILNEWWILTAAQCLQSRSYSSIYAVVGSNSLDSGVASYRGNRIVLHPQYDYGDSWRNDIGLLRVYDPIHITWGTIPARIPKKGQDIPIGATATVVGWGSLAAGENASNDLRSLSVTVVDSLRCNQTYHYYKLNVYDTEICAGGILGRGTCDGDMGGPLFFNDEVVGIVSWGKPCAQQGYPTVYTKVSNYSDWIANAIR